MPFASSEVTKAPPLTPDVEVEVEDAAVEELLERAQAADLVDGAGDAAARADQGDLASSPPCGDASARVDRVRDD